MHDFLMDVRHGARTLARRPVFTATAVLTLALGLGLTTAVLSVVYTVVLAPPPFADPGSLVQIARLEGGRRPLLLPPADVPLIREAAVPLGDIGVTQFRDVALGGGTSPIRVRGVVVTASTLRMLGIAPVAGRLPADADDRSGGPCVTVLSHAIAVTRYGGPAAATGSDVRIDGESCTVVAVMPQGFAFPAPWFAPGDVWLLSGPSRVDWSAATGPGMLVFARLAPGIGLERARAALDGVAERHATAHPRLTGVQFTALAYAAPSRESSQRRLLTLLIAAALVLVIACVNVINLQLGRSADRHIEMATRAAMGASRGRLVRQLLAENLVLLTAAAVAGLMVAGWSLNLIVGLRSFIIPRMEEATIDGIAVVACFTLALIAGLGAGIYPALRGSDLDAARKLVVAGRGSTMTPRWRRFQRGLVSLESALALLLLAGAALLLQSYSRATGIDPGYRTADVLHARITPPAGRYAGDALVDFYDRVQEHLAGVTGVLDVALADVPPGAGAGADQPFAIAGQAAAQGTWPLASWRAVTASYFRTIGIPTLRGGFDQREAEPRLVVVNEQFVRQYFPDRDPIGQRLHLVSSVRAEAPDADAWTVAGVVADAREEHTWRPPPPIVYARAADRPHPSMAILARTAPPPLSVVSGVQAAVAQVDPDQPVYGLRTLSFIVASEFDLNRLSMTLLALFAITALLLAVAGMYGVVAHSVGQRLREIGLRMALGAMAGDVLRMIVAESARYAAAGAAAGLTLAAALAGRLATLAPGWVGTDWRVLALAALLVMLAALVAAWVPARRAARLDPQVALRHE